MNPLTRLSKTPTTFCCGLRGTACSRRLARRRRRLWLLRLRGRSVLHRPSPPPASHTRLSSAFDTSTKLTGQMLPLSPLPANTCSKHAAPPEKARGNILALYKAAIKPQLRPRGKAFASGAELCQRRISLESTHQAQHRQHSTPARRPSTEWARVQDTRSDTRTPKATAVVPHHPTDTVAARIAGGSSPTAVHQRLVRCTISAALSTCEPTCKLSMSTQHDERKRAEMR